MDFLLLLAQAAQTETDMETEKPGFPAHILKIWEDRNQYEEAVQVLLQEYEQAKPRDIFY